MNLRLVHPVNKKLGNTHRGPVMSLYTLDATSSKHSKRKSLKFNKLNFVYRSFNKVLPHHIRYYDNKTWHLFRGRHTASPDWKLKTSSVEVADWQIVVGVAPAHGWCFWGSLLGWSQSRRKLKLKAGNHNSPMCMVACFTIYLIWRKVFLFGLCINLHLSKRA